jgi:hypothetical protein
MAMVCSCLVIPGMACSCEPYAFPPSVEVTYAGIQLYKKNSN